MNSPLVVYTLFACAIGHFHAAPQDPGGDASLEDTCPDPPTLERLRLVTNVNENGTGFKVGTKLKYRCASGYASSSRPSPWDVECVKDYDGRLRWRDIQTDCRPISCGHPGHLWNGKLLDAVFSFSSKVRYECDPGYNLVGQAEIYCQSDGTWTDPAPECHVVECGRPEEIPNGHVEFSSVEYGAEATYSCIKGFTLEPKNAQRTCGRDGVWTGGYISCTEITCDPPKAPIGGGLSSIAEDAGKQRMGTIVTYSCPEGKRLVGSKTSSCLAIGMWSFDAPTCADKCYVPASENAKVLIANRWSTKELPIGTDVSSQGGKLLLQCDDGYEIEGKTRINIGCTDGHWELPRLNCTEAPCRNITNISHGYPTARTVESGYSVEYRCDRGYKLEAHGGNIRCQKGKLQGKLPLCKRTFCYRTDIPKNARHMKATKDVYEAGEYLEYSCLPGFITTGSRMRCDDGTWTGDYEPFCRGDTPQKYYNEDSLKMEEEGGSRIHGNMRGTVGIGEGGPTHSHRLDSTASVSSCHNISDIPNGYPTARTVESGDSVEYRCDPDYKLVAQREQLRCENGNLQGSVPSCRPSESLGKSGKPCKVPERQPRFKAYAGNKRYLPGNMIPHGTELRFHCDPFAEVKFRGNNTSKCNNGKWSKDIPYCYKLDTYDVVVRLPLIPENHVSPDAYLNVDPRTLLKLECESYYYEPKIATDPETTFLRANPTCEWKGGFYKTCFLSVNFYVPEGYDGIVECSNDNSSKVIKLRGRRPFECSPPSSEDTVITRTTKEVYKVECTPPSVLTGTAHLNCYANGEFDRPAPYCALPTREPIQSPNIAAQSASDGNFSRTLNGQKQTNGTNGTIPHGSTSGSANAAGSQPYLPLGSEPQNVGFPNTARAQNESSEAGIPERGAAAPDSTEEISHKTKLKHIQAYPETVSASSSVYAELPRSCSVSNFSPQLRGFINYQRINTPVPVPHNTTVRFHCEPVGEAPGEPFIATCSDGIWTTPNNRYPVQISSRCREPMDYVTVIKILNESEIRTGYEVGPLGTVYVPLGSKIHLECGPRHGATGVPVTWTVWSHRNGAWIIFDHTASSISFDVHLGDSYEVKCRIQEKLKMTLHIMESDLRFCNEPMLASEVLLLQRNSLHLEFGCKEGFLLQGPKNITCTRDGTWNQEPPVCIRAVRKDSVGGRSTSEGLRTSERPSHTPPTHLGHFPNENVGGNQHQYKTENGRSASSEMATNVTSQNFPGAVRKDSVGGRSTSEGLRTSERPSHTLPTQLGHFPNENVGGNQHRYKTENGRSASSEMATKVTSQNFPGSVRKDSMGGRSTSEGLRTSERPSHTLPTHLGHFPNENVGGNQHRYKTENGRSASSEMATKVTSQNLPGAVRKDSVGSRSTSEGLRTSERPSRIPPTHLGHFPNENVGANQHRYKTENGHSASSEMATKVASQPFPVPSRGAWK